MGEGQVADDPHRLLRDFVEGVGALDAEEEVIVGEHDPLRHPRCAAGVDQRRAVARLHPPHSEL